MLPHLGWESSLHFPPHFAFSTPTLKIFKYFLAAEGHLVPVPCLGLSPTATHAEVCCPGAKQHPTTLVRYLKAFQLVSGAWGRKIISFTISILNADLSLLTFSEINPQTKAVDHTVSCSSSQVKDGSTPRKSVYFVFYHFSHIISILLLSEVQILFTQMEVRRWFLWPALPTFLRSWHFCCLYVK